MRAFLYAVLALSMLLGVPSVAFASEEAIDAAVPYQAVLVVIQDVPVSATNTGYRRSAGGLFLQKLLDTEIIGFKTATIQGYKAGPYEVGWAKHKTM